MSGVFRHRRQWKAFCHAVAFMAVGQWRRIEALAKPMETTEILQEGNAEDRQERTMSLRQRQEIQEVLRRMNA